MVRLVIPRKEDIINTSHDLEEDPVDFYYKPFLGYIYKKRLKMCISLIGKKRFNKLLDVGYGSGIFFPTLKKISNELYGIDMHPKNKEVEKIFNKYFKVELQKGNVLKMPYKKETFDSIISISTLEHIKDIKKAIFEINRVMKKDGSLFIGMPIRNKLTDIFFNFIGDHEPVDRMHPTNNKNLINALRNGFRIKRIITFPKYMPLNLSFYCCIEAEKK